MEPTIIGSWSKRSSRAIATSSADEGPGGLRPQKRLKHRASVSEHDSSGPEGDEPDKKCMQPSHQRGDLMFAFYIYPFLPSP